MSIGTNKTADGRKVPPAVLAVAVAALIVFIAWRAWAAFAPVSAGPLPPPPTQDINYINAKARECQGDFNKLSPEDQAKVQQVSHGFGPASMASTWRELSQKAH